MAQPPFNALRLGRYTSILLSILGLIIFGFGTAFVSSLHQYLFFRFGVSQALVGFNINSVSLGEARLLRVKRGSLGRWRMGCVGVGRTSLQNRVATQSHGSGGKNPHFRLPGGAEKLCPDSLPLPSSILTASHPTHSPLVSLDTPTWLMLIEP